MTEFMRRVDQAVRGQLAVVRRPTLTHSRHLSTGQGAHEQVETRAYAEQLLSEANAVLASCGGTTLSLDDLSGTLDQVFVIRFGAGWAQFATRFRGDRSYAELQGSSVSLARHQLVDGGSLEDLIVALVTDELDDTSKGVPDDE